MMVIIIIIIIMLLRYRAFSSAAWRGRTLTSVSWMRQRTGVKPCAPAHTVATIAVYKPECRVMVCQY